MALPGDARREPAQRITRCAQADTKRTGARFEQAVERHSAPVQAIALYCDAPRQQPETIR